MIKDLDSGQELTGMTVVELTRMTIVELTRMTTMELTELQQWSALE